MRPWHLTVADYILSDQIGVERKSVEDLLTSFASGRLFRQAEALCKKFPKPVLLIEWLPREEFMLPRNSASTENILGPKYVRGKSLFGTKASKTQEEINIEQDVRTKLTILVQHNPSLRILWSRSPEMSARIFLSLKQNQAEPIPEEQPSLESQSSSTVKTPPERKESYSSFDDDSEIQEFLLHLPGITESNIETVMSRIPVGMTLSQLSQMREVELLTLIEDKQAAHSLFTLFNNEC